jgi:uncharacterized protein (TIGR00369 family)
MAETENPSPGFGRDTTLDELNALSRGTAMEPLGIVFTDIGADYLRATMPVDDRTRQPYGLLHGGASVLLAETLGSTAGMLRVQPGQRCVGIEINANHVRPAADGYVHGTARPVNLGRTLQVWEVRISNEQDKLVCIARVTMAVLNAASQY